MNLISGSALVYETIVFGDPSLWGDDSSEAYKDYPAYDLEEEDVEGRLVARLPSANDVFFKDNEKLLKFKTSNNPNIDIWFRRSSDHEARSRIQWRYLINKQRKQIYHNSLLQLSFRSVKLLALKVLFYTSYFI